MTPTTPHTAPQTPWGYQPTTHGVDGAGVAFGGRGVGVSKPRALDLFCGAGGASMGLHRAGFDVTGVDIRPQPRYPFRFVQADATMPPVRLEDFDFVWASPMCQAHSVGSKRWHKEWPCQIAPIRELLQSSGRPWCIENVPGAPIRVDLVLTGPTFGLKTWRRRHFEISGFYCLEPPRGRVQGPKTTPGFCTIAGHGGDGPNRYGAWAEAMGIDWMDKDGIRQSIPPAYSEFIGRAILAQEGR